MHPSKVTLRPKVRRPMAWDSTKSAPSAQQPEPSTQCPIPGGYRRAETRHHRIDHPARLPEDALGLLPRGVTDAECGLRSRPRWRDLVCASGELSRRTHGRASSARAGRRGGASIATPTWRSGTKTCCRSPSARCAQCATFLGESFDQAMLQPMVPPIGGDRDSPAVDGGIARTNSGRGRLELPVEDRRVFEAVAGSVLADVGYELEGHDTSVGRAARIRWTLQELVR